MSKFLVDTHTYYNLKKKNEELKKKYAMLKKYLSIIKDTPDGKDINNVKKFYINLIENTPDIQYIKQYYENMIEEFENRKKTRMESQGFPTNYKKEGISICLTAWQTQDFIEECLDSIEKQTYFVDFNDYEILLGIDACEQTLEKVKQIQYKYRNLRVFMMNKNVGTYITTNTVMKIAKYDWLLRFDTDDIMNSNMVETLMTKKGDADFVRFNMQNFPKDNALGYNEFVQAEGQMLVSKHVFNTYGGFQPWLCGADSEFITRLKNRIKFIKINEVLFKRRIHNGGLTSRKETSLTSGIREKYKNYIRDHSRFVTTIETVTEAYTELPKYQVYVNFTTYPARERSTIQMLEHFKKQLIKPNKIICWLAVDEYGGKNVPRLLKPFVNEKFIEIRWVRENLYGFKRYMIFKENNDYIYNIFIDDDILYDVNYVKDMYQAARKYKNLPICYCGYAFDYVGTDAIVHDIEVGKASHKHAYLSGFSCMPPKVFPVEMFEYEKQRKQINPKSDDDWINAWLLKEHKPVVLLNSRKHYNWKTINGTRANGIFTTHNSKQVNGVRNRIANFAKSCVFCGDEEIVKQIWPKFDLKKCCQGKYEQIKNMQIK